MRKKHLVTAALPYANGPLHIGHIAGCYLPADIYVRFLKRKGEDVKFICGSDEHGVAITMRARKEGVQPQNIVDRYHEMMKKAFQEFGIQFDIYSRTSNPIHHQTAQDFFSTLHNNGVFEDRVSAQYFDTEAQQFLADRYIMGTCPTCSNPDAYGDQCEKCGRTLSPSELLNPRSTLSGSKPILKDTRNWFLPLDKMADDIRAFLNTRQNWKPNVLGQCKSWLDSGDGLQPRSMTRDMDWGVKVPLDQAAGKVLYVWFDAPIGYISATKELLPNTWEEYWKGPSSRLVHFIGKDNIVFHCIIFPAMLMAHGGYQLPEAVPANEFLNLEGQKISTSRNWAVWLHEYLTDFPDKQDVLRYALCATAPETKDNDFTWNDFQSRNNNELLAILGNFLNRVFVLLEKNHSGLVPPISDAQAVDKIAIEEILKTCLKIEHSIENYKFREALQEFMQMARIGNKYLADLEPWKVQKINPERSSVILGVAARMAALIGQVAEPFLPFTSSKINSAFNLTLMPWNDIINLDFFNWINYQPITNPGLLFEKIEDEAIAIQREKLEKSTPVTNATSVIKNIPAFKPNVNFDDFSKLDIRMGKIIDAKPVEKTDKLMHLQVSLGLETRSIVSGIAQFFKAEELIGKQAIVLANLEAKKIKGIWSQGMLLFVEDEDGRLVNPANQFAVPDGSVLS